MPGFSQKLKKMVDFLGLRKVARSLEANIWLQFFTILLTSLVIFWGAFSFFAPRINCFSEFYDERLRGFLFSGFLTVGSFLLSLKTFVVVSLKDKLFDSDKYVKKYMERNGLECDSHIDLPEFYAPLANLTGFLFFSILFSILTSVAQFSIGIVGNAAANVFCIWLALFTVLLLLNCLRLIRKNILVWLGYK